MAISTIKATVNGEEISLTLNSSTGKYEATVTAPNLSTNSADVPLGYFPVSITATDTAGNSTTVNTSDASFGENLKLLVKEEVKPTVQVSSPSSGTYYTSKTVNLEFFVYDNKNGQTAGYSGVNRDTIRYSYEGSSYTPSAITEVTGGYRCTDTVTLDDGTYTFEFSATDRDGNASVPASVSFIVDTVKPDLYDVKINDSTSETYETNQSSLTITGKTNDGISGKNVTINITVDGADQGEVTVSSEGTFSKTITLSSDKTYTIAVTATDQAGNSISVTRTVIYNTTAPRFRSVTITPNPAYAGKTYTISVEVE